MTPAESIALDVDQLVDRTEERAEYAERITKHTPGCEACRAQLRHGVPAQPGDAGRDIAKTPAIPAEPGRLRHHACSCPRYIAQRGRTVHDGALLWQLTAVTAVVGGQVVPGEAVPAGSPWDDDGALAPPRAGASSPRSPCPTR